MSESKPGLAERLKRLEEITRTLEKSDLDLEVSIKLYEEGINLVKACSKELDEAQVKIMKLTPDSVKVEIEESTIIDE